MKVDLEQAAEAARRADNAQGMLGATGQSPADALALLRKVGSVTEVGSETIDGAKTTHYSATVDIAEALENAGAPAEALAAVRASGLETKVPVDVWVGADDGYVHRVHVSYSADRGRQELQRRADDDAQRLGHRRLDRRPGRRRGARRDAVARGPRRPPVSLD